MTDQVVLYTTPTCPWCNKAKSYLAKKGIPFAEYNVAQDANKYTEMVSRSGQTGVPVITIGNQVIVGFDQKKIDELLED